MTTKILDISGIVASILCAIHCFALPLIATVPLISNHHGHGIFFIVSIAIALLALGAGWLSHKQAYIPMVGFAGIVCIATHHIGFIVLGAVLLIASHGLNYLECQKQKECCGH